MYEVDMEVETEWVCLVISPYHWMGSQNEINPRPKYGENGEVHLARSFYHPIARHSWPHPKNRPVPIYCIGYYGFYMVSEVMPWQTNPNSTHCQSTGKTRNALLREWSSLITANVRPHWHPMIHPHAGSTMAFLSTNVRHYQVSRSVDPRNPSSLWCTLVLS